MNDASCAAGMAALSICESILLSLTDGGVIDEAEAKAILGDAAAGHREAEREAADGEGRHHAETAALIEAIIDHGDSVRRVRPRPGHG